jgi:hypothetical protein
MLTQDILQSREVNRHAFFCSYLLAISYRLACKGGFDVLREHRTLSEFKRVAGGQKNPQHYYKLTLIGRGFIPTQLRLETAARIS